MKVRTVFTFEELQLRTIRAALGRGGKATRKECVTFIDRAVRAALDKAPEAKPARAKLLKAAPKPRPTIGAETTEQAIAQREHIKGMYRTEGMMTAEILDAFCAEGGL